MWIHTVFIGYISALPRVTHKTKALLQALQVMGTFLLRLISAQSNILASLHIPMRQWSRIHH